MKKTKTKGFKFTNWVSPSNSSTPSSYTIYAGNFVMELRLPNALKITGFKVLKDRLDVYLKQHNGKLPNSIRCTKRQYYQYEDLFMRQILWVNKNNNLVFHGIPLIRYGKETE